MCRQVVFRGMTLPGETERGEDLRGCQNAWIFLYLFGVGPFHPAASVQRLACRRNLGLLCRFVAFSPVKANRWMVVWP